MQQRLLRRTGYGVADQNLFVRDSAMLHSGSAEGMGGHVANLSNADHGSLNKISRNRRQR
jgi:hypothetical protein